MDFEGQLLLVQQMLSVEADHHSMNTTRKEMNSIVVMFGGGEFHCCKGVKMEEPSDHSGHMNCGWQREEDWKEGKKGVPCQIRY